MVNSKDDREAVNCERISQEISNYIEGEVDPRLRAAMDDHFKTCPRCTSVLEGTRNVIRLYSDERLIAECTTNEEMIAVPAGYSRRLEKRLAGSVRPSRSRWSSLSAWLVPVAAVALIAGGLRFANWRAHTPPLNVQTRPEHTEPPNNIPSDLVVVVSTDTDSKLFHVAGCPLIHDKNKVRTLTAKEAMEQGYTPCPQCLRKYLNVAGNRGAAADDDDDHDAEANAAVHDDGR